jgi:hypothetical protein
MEIAARITKPLARKYGCDMKIDFSKGAREVIFLGSPSQKEQVVSAVWDIFSHKGYSPFRRLLIFFREFIK